MGIDLIGVIGGGQMGSGIARSCALAGSSVIVCEADAKRAEAARVSIERSLERAVRAGRVDQRECDDALGRLRTTSDLHELGDRSIVIEAVVEDKEVKLGVLAALDSVVGPDAILASNTSSLPITTLAAGTMKPARVIGMHFFNPVPARPLVEIVSTPLTDAAVADRAERYVTSVLGKQAIRCTDRAGFVVNALLTPYLLAAIRMAESGFATPAEIDAGMQGGCGHPVGPLALADFVGLDVLLAASTSMYAEFSDAGFAPPPLLRRMVDSGLYGRKTGRGFFDYAERP